MKRKSALPFLTLSEPAIGMSPWIAKLDEHPKQPLSEYLPNWEYYSRLQISRSASVDYKAAAEMLNLRPGSFELIVVVDVATGPGTIPRQIVTQVEFPVSDRSNEIELRLDLQSEQLSGQILLTTNVLLHSIGKRLTELAPSQAGARLWSDTTRSRLEGEEPRFPMEEASFDIMFADRPQASALWYLHFDPSRLDGDLHGAIRLYLNADNPDFIERVKSEDPLTLRMLLADVISLISERALGMKDASEILVGSEPGSLARQVLHWLQMAFPGSSIERIQATCEGRPGEFRSALQSIAEI